MEKGRTTLVPFFWRKPCKFVTCEHVDVPTPPVTHLPWYTHTQVARLLERAAKNRAVAATLCNERSSRSHGVFRFKLTGINKNTGEACQGNFKIVGVSACIGLQYTW